MRVFDRSMYTTRALVCIIISLGRKNLFAEQTFMAVCLIQIKLYADCELIAKHLREDCFGLDGIIPVTTSTKTIFGHKRVVLTLCWDIFLILIAAVRTMASTTVSPDSLLLSS